MEQCRFVFWELLEILTVAFTSLLEGHRLPTDQTAVEGLAHANFLARNRQQALKVLEDTSTLHFSIEAQKRFEALKGLYGQ